MSVDFNTLAQQFCDFYYQQFDQDRSSLGNLYVRIIFIIDLFICLFIYQNTNIQNHNYNQLIAIQTFLFII